MPLDSSWSPTPPCAAFSNNAHCFAKGLQTLLSCCERVGFERRELQYQLENARIKMLTSEGGDIVEPTENDVGLLRALYCGFTVFLVFFPVVRGFRALRF